VTLLYLAENGITGNTGVNINELFKRGEHMACTQSMLTSFRGNLLGWARDTGHNWETLRITLVIPEKGSRYLKHCGPVPDEHFPILSEKGIAIKLKQSH